MTRGIGHVIRQIRDEAASGSAARNGLTVLLANPEGEMHELALEVLECRIASEGHRTIVSGGGAPPRDVAKRALETGADLVLVSATLTKNRESALRTVDAILDRHHGTLVALGGQAWTGTRRPTTLDPRVRVLNGGPAKDALAALVTEAGEIKKGARAAHAAARAGSVS